MVWKNVVTGSSSQVAAPQLDYGTAELVALSFKNAGHENYFFYYITFMIGLSLITYVFMKDTKKHSMITDD